MPQRLARPIGFLVQSGQIEMRVAQQRVLGERVAIRRDRFVFPLEILEQRGEIERQKALDVRAWRYNCSASLSFPSRCSNRPRLIRASR